MLCRTNKLQRNSTRSVTAKTKFNSKRAQLRAGFAMDALLGCTRVYITEKGDIEVDHGACMLRGADGLLREPERRGVPYDPNATIGERLEHWGDVPWHLWDLRSPGSVYGKIAAKDIVRQVEQLYAIRTELRDVARLSTWLQFNCLERPRLPSIVLIHKNVHACWLASTRCRDDRVRRHAISAGLCRHLWLCQAWAYCITSAHAFDCDSRMHTA